MKTIEINLYTFDELSLDIQEKVLDQERDCNVEFDDWYDFILDDWTRKLFSLGYEDSKISFRGFCSQGDGACFTCSINIPAWIKANKETKRFGAIARHIKNGKIEIIASIESKNFHYTHEHTVGINYEWYWYGSERYNPENINANNKLYHALKELPTVIIENARILMRQIYNELEKDYDYLVSDDAIKETIKANEWTFEANGRMNNG